MPAGSLNDDDAAHSTDACWPAAQINITTSSSTICTSRHILSLQWVQLALPCESVRSDACGPHGHHEKCECVHDFPVYD